MSKLRNLERFKSMMRRKTVFPVFMSEELTQLNTSVNLGKRSTKRTNTSSIPKLLV